MTELLKYDLQLLTPITIVAAGSFLMLILEALAGTKWSRASVAAIVLLAALAGSVHYAPLFTDGQRIMNGMLYADSFSWYVGIIIIVAALFSVMMGRGKLNGEGIGAPGEYYTLLLMSTTGALIFISSAELITFFLALEIMSMALYCMCGSALNSEKSSESALKYFLLGSFSSAFLLYGIAFVYGLAGTTMIPEAAAALSGSTDILLYIAIGLVLVGLAFKIAVVPFHFWAPDVYEGAPTPVTVFMATVIKAAAVAGGLRIMWSLFGEFFDLWQGAVWLMAVLTIILGNLIALRQRNVKRMLAYSSIAHAGYLMVAFLIPGAEYAGGAAALYYLVMYSMMTLGAFGILFIVATNSKDKENPEDISQFYGFAKRNPVLAFLMAFFMLSLAGLPPGMGGFLGKFYIFSGAIKAGYIGLSIIGIAGSLISCYYYLRIIVAMYFIEDEESEGLPALEPGFSASAVLVACAAGVLLFGILPAGIYHLAATVASGI